MNPEYKKHEDSYTKVYYNQIIERNEKGKVFKDMLYIKRNKNKDDSRFLIKKKQCKRENSTATSLKY